MRKKEKIQLLLTPESIRIKNENFFQSPEIY